MLKSETLLKSSLVTDVKDTVKKEEAKEMFEYL